jgi:lipopolysaccharide export system protein LptA
VNARARQWLCVAAALALAPAALAQSPKPSPIFKGTQESKGEPVKIQAATLEVRDKDKVATFSGNVILIQGDTEVRCDALVVFYEGELSRGAKAPPPPTAGGKQRNQQISKMEARGNVVVIQKDQRATGDRGDFNMRNNTVTLTGNVVVTRGDDILRGQRLLVNLSTGVSTIESGGGRVEALIKSNQGKNQDFLGDALARPKRNK